MSGNGSTTPAMLERAARIGAEAGLQFVYAGNLPGSRRRPRGHPLPVLPARRSSGAASFMVRENRLDRAPDAARAARPPIPGRWA